MSRKNRRARAMLAKPKVATNVKRSEDFVVATRAAARPRDSRAPVGMWTLPQIFAARDAQMRGDFRQAVRVAEQMRTDPALHVARKNRLEAQKGIGVALVAADDSAKAEKVRLEADALYGESGVGVSSQTFADIEGCLVDHAVAIGYNAFVPRADGTRVDIVHTFWPLEFVRWDSITSQLMTRVADGTPVPIVHGDGTWTIYAKHADHPWRQDAAVLPGCVIWARHAYAERDMSKGSNSHGNAKVIGEMAPGVALQKDNGEYTDQAAALLETLRSIAVDEFPVGIIPSGAKVNYLTNSSMAWQIFDKLLLNAEKAAARVYLGTDGTLGSQGGAPGIDVQALFGVARTYIEGDLRCIERCFFEGVLVPWCATNFGDSSLTPRRVYQIPDADADATVDALAKRRQAFFADVEQIRARGFTLTQDEVVKLATSYRVDPPKLSEAAKKSTFALAPTDVVKWLTPNEVRGTGEAGPLVLPNGTPDPIGTTLIGILEARAEQAKIEAAKVPAAPAALDAAPAA